MADMSDVTTLHSTKAAPYRLAQGELSHPDWPRDERLVIVGKRGYIGDYLARCAEARCAQLVALSSDDCNFLRREDVEQLFRSLKDTPCTILFLAVVDRRIRNTYEAFLDNVTMVKHLIDGHHAAPVRGILYFSAAELYGRAPELPITEVTPLNPYSWYGLAKQTCEWMLLRSGQVECPVTVLRVPGIYGQSPGDHSTIHELASDIQHHQHVTLRVRETLLRDYVYLDDLCRVIHELSPLRYHGIVNVATGTSRRLIDLITLISQVLVQPCAVTRESTASSSHSDLVFDTRLLRSLLPDFQFSDIMAGLGTYRVPAKCGEPR